MPDARTCRACGDPIPDSKHESAKYCDGACRRKAWADRKASSVAAEIAEDVREMVERRLRDAL